MKTHYLINTIMIVAIKKIANSESRREIVFVGDFFLHNELLSWTKWFYIFFILIIRNIWIGDGSILCDSHRTFFPEFQFCRMVYSRQFTMRNVMNWEPTFNREGNYFLKGQKFISDSSDFVGDFTFQVSPTCFFVFFRKKKVDALIGM